MKTSIQIDLPEHLAEEARAAGLLETRVIEVLLRKELRRREASRLFETVRKLHAADLPPMTDEEIQAEIEATRAKRRADNAGRR